MRKAKPIYCSCTCTNHVTSISRLRSHLIQCHATCFCSILQYCFYICNTPTNPYIFLGILFLFSVYYNFNVIQKKFCFSTNIDHSKSRKETLYKYIYFHFEFLCIITNNTHLVRNYVTNIFPINQETEIALLINVIHR